MKPLPDVEISYKPLYDIVRNPIAARLLMAGIELGIFDALEEFHPAENIAAALHTHPANTRRFLDALATIGLVEKRTGRFRNRPLAATFLVTSSPVYVGTQLNGVEQMCVKPLADLPAMIRSGPGLATGAPDISSEALWAEATRASAAWVTTGEVGTKMAAMLAELPEFPGFRRMLDLGGGHGMFTLYFVQAHPEMTGVVFDRPAVVSVAEEFIKKYDMESRVSVMAGDYLTDSIGGGYDLIWACSTLNFALPDIDPLVTKVFDALNPGGLFIAFQDGLTHEGTRPEVMLGFLAETMRLDRDFSFRQGQIADAMLRCGFRSVRSHTIRTAMEEMDLDIARK